MKKLFLIFYVLILLQVILAIITYIKISGRFWGICDFIESFFFDGGKILLPLLILGFSIAGFCFQSIRTNKLHITFILMFSFVELIKVIMCLLDMGGPASWPLSL